MSHSDESALIALDATQAAQRIATGATTSVALVESCLSRIAARDAEIGAWAYVDPDWALAQARAADKARAQPGGGGPLNGVPVAIKDIIDTHDMPTEYGTPIYKGHRPDRDAFCVAQLRAAGAVILGKTVTTELASLTPTTTHNPAAPGRTPGGSSSGTAAAIAAGMVPAGLGTQTAGSVIRPAAFCGLYGFKPTIGLVSRMGVLPQSHTLDTIGVLARSLDDIALLTEVMAAADPADPISMPGSRPRLVAALAAQGAPAPRFAVVKPAWSLVDEATKAAFDGLVTRLGGAAAAVTIEGLDEVIEDQRIVQLAENAGYYGPLLDAHEALLSPAMVERLKTGIGVPVRRYVDAILRLQPAVARFHTVVRPGTVILTLAALGPAPRGLATTGNPIMNGLWTYLGMPALTLPLLSVDGAPVGVQVVGARGNDGAVLQAARWLERALAAG